MQSFDEINSSAGYGGDTITGKSKMADGGHTCRRIGNKLGRTQLDHFGNIPDKFQKNLNNGLGGDAVTRLVRC